MSEHKAAGYIPAAYTRLSYVDAPENIRIPAVGCALCWTVVISWKLLSTLKW